MLDRVIDPRGDHEACDDAEPEVREHRDPRVELRLGPHPHASTVVDPRRPTVEM